MMKNDNLFSKQFVVDLHVILSVYM